MYVSVNKSKNVIKIKVWCKYNATINLLSYQIRTKKFLQDSLL